MARLHPLQRHLASSEKPMKLPTSRTLKGLHLAALLMLATAAQAQAAQASAPDAGAQVAEAALRAFG
jgi:hypothetical protein